MASTGDFSIDRDEFSAAFTVVVLEATGRPPVTLTKRPAQDLSIARSDRRSLHEVTRSRRARVAAPTGEVVPSCPLLTLFA